jgi:hypothetical protein
MSYECHAVRWFGRLFIVKINWARMDFFHHVQRLAFGAGGNQQSTTFAIGRNQSIG